MKKLVVYLSLRLPEFTVSEEQVARWRALMPELRIEFAASEAELFKLLPETDYVLAFNFKSTWFSRAPRLKWVASPGAGRELLPDWVPDGVLITPGAFHGEIISETVLGMVLAVNRGLLEGVLLQQQGAVWPDRQLNGLRRLNGTTAVILGYGAIGHWIADRLKLMGVEVIGVRRGNPSREAGVVLVDDIDRVLPEADHLILALPGDRTTDKILDARRLSLLKPDAAVYNVGRGNAIDEDALADALERGHLRAACLDVTAQEPYPAGGRLMRAPRCYLMPHVSAVAPDYLDLAFNEWQCRYRAYQAEGTL